MRKPFFIDGIKLEANANKFTFVWRKSVERYSSNLIEKSNVMYDELLEKEIIPAIERENEKLQTGNTMEQQILLSVQIIED